MAEEKEKPITMIVNIFHGERVLATKVKVMRDELLSLREGAFNLEHNLKELSAKAVRDSFTLLEKEKNV